MEGKSDLVLKGIMGDGGPAIGLAVHLLIEEGGVFFIVDWDLIL